MPYKEVFVPADKFLEHNGVSIYNTYKNDDYENVIRTYYFVVDPSHGEEQAFDVRDLPIERVLVDETNDLPIDTESKVRLLLITAINTGIIDAKGVRSVR